MKTIIRKLNFFDIPKVIDIYKTENLKKIHKPAVIDSPFERLFLYLSTLKILKRYYSYIVLIGKEIVGFAYVREKNNHKKFGIIIKKSYQGKGIGTKLIKATIRGHKPLRLGVISTNRPAIHLYRKLGFRNEKIQIWMVKK